MTFLVFFVVIVGVAVAMIVHHCAAAEHYTRKGERAGMEKARRWFCANPFGFLRWAEHGERRGQ